MEEEEEHRMQVQDKAKQEAQKEPSERTYPSYASLAELSGIGIIEC